MHTFYNGLNASARTIIDASVGGALMKKTTVESKLIGLLIHFSNLYYNMNAD